MNPLTNVKNLNKLNERELEMGLAGSGSSWHRKYRDSAWIFVGGLPYDLTEGDVVCVFSQYGELVNINMVRDKATGKTKGFCFICYEDQRSTDLAVDNFNGIKLLGRTIRVDHVENYKIPKEDPKHELDEITKKIRSEGIAPQASPSSEEEEELLEITPPKKKKKEKKMKKEKKKKKKKKSKSSSEESGTDSSSDEDEPRRKRRVKSEPENIRVKSEKVDPDYDKYHHRDSGRSGSYRIKTEDQNTKERIKQEHKSGRRKRHESQSDSEEERIYQKAKRQSEKRRQRSGSTSSNEVETGHQNRRRDDYRERRENRDDYRRRDRDRDQGRRRDNDDYIRKESRDRNRDRRDRSRSRDRDRSRSRDRDRRRYSDRR